MLILALLYLSGCMALTGWLAHAFLGVNDMTSLAAISAFVGGLFVAPTLAWLLGLMAQALGVFIGLVATASHSKNN